MSLNRSLLAFASLFSAAFCSIAGTYPANNGTQNFDFPDGTSDLKDGSAIGSDAPAGAQTPLTGIYSSALRLLKRDTTNSIGSFKLPDIDPNNVIRTFDARFTVVMDKSAELGPAEGFSFNFGRLPADNGTGEGGFAPLRGGLTLAWDTRDNGDDPTSIQVAVDGTIITNVPRTYVYGIVSRTATIHWDAAGLDLSFDNKVIFADLPTPGFVPRVGDRFGFTARSSDGSYDLNIDGLKVSTTGLPVIDTGGPIISEFVAHNSLFEDEFTQKPGWIELFNGNPEQADLEGWYLTDSRDDLKRWPIHGIAIKPYNYQVVFASGRDLALSSTHWPHASFKLANEGGYLALVKPDGVTIASAIDYGPQSENVSFGEKGVERTRGFMFPASPGAVNSVDPTAGPMCPEVNFSHAGGPVTSAVTLALSVSNLVNGEIRYTTNGTEPTASSSLYSTPIEVTAYQMIKAKAFATGRIPSRTTSRLFVMLDPSIANYNGSGAVFDSNIPLLFIDSYGVSVDGSSGGSNPFRPGFAFVFPTDLKTGRASLLGNADYMGNCGVHVRGESSSGFDQRSYALEIQDPTGLDKDASLLGMPGNSDWVLYGPWSEKTLMRNKLIFDWMIRLRGQDGMAMRTRFVELFFNQTKPSTGKVTYTTAYRGIYVLMEKLKRGADRVPLENLNDKTVDPEMITGGYIIRKDKDDTLKNNWSGAAFPLQSFDPDRLNTPQFNYIKGYVASFETALNKADYRNTKTGYQAYIDPDTFIDAQWMLEIAKQVDGYVFSTYWHKDRGGRLRAGPLWDFNISLGNADYATGDTPKGWLYDNAEGAGQLWYPRLHTDANYRVAHWDRYWHMRTRFMATPQVMETINQHMRTLLDGYTGGVSNRAPAEIQNPVARHFRKWPRLGTRDWPNPAAATSIKTWQAEVDYMKNWISNRLEWLDDQSLRTGTTTYRPPVFSHLGGVVTSPVDLTLSPYKVTKAGVTYATGTVYFTLDGTDPRLPSGTVHPKAFAFSSPIHIESALTVQARLYNASSKAWSPLAIGTFFYNAPSANHSNLVISEIQYHPGDLSTDERAAGLVDSERLEFIELRNISSTPLHLGGVKVTRGVDFDFSLLPTTRQLLQPGETTLLVADPRAFSQRYPNIPATRIAGQFLGQLDNGGEPLRVEAADGSVIQQLTYDDRTPWPFLADGSGRSLVLAKPNSNPNPADPFNWLPSAKSGGTPGTFGAGEDIFLGVAGTDSDGDGLSDLFEFATGSDPENGGSAFYPTVRRSTLEVNGTSSRYLVFEYRRSSTAKGVQFHVESTSDLRTWLPVNTELSPVASQDNGDGTISETLRSTSPLNGSQAPTLYLRLKVSEQ